ncbi:MAG: phosphatidate cytidylyltransferase [Alphaproteobacteria bacterium]|nr:MAG: phosphatidate cytidylyltransferase [Alphaproteobacteria bacterium]
MFIVYFTSLAKTVLIVFLSVEAYTSTISRKIKYGWLWFGLLCAVIHVLVTNLFVCYEFALVCVAFSSLVDTLAYVTGKIIQGPKLIPSISPNKTVAGFIGGTFIIPAVVFLLNYTHSLNWIGVLFVENFVGILLSRSHVLMAELLLFILSATIAAQLGDILISFIKRKIKVKDFGNILPGHGGLWDRFDSVLGTILFSKPLYILISYILKYTCMNK